MCGYILTNIDTSLGTYTSANPVTQVANVVAQDDHSEYLNSIFKLPSTQVNPQSNRPKRKTNPHCRVLAKAEVIGEKEQEEKKQEEAKIRKEQRKEKVKIMKQKREEKLKARIVKQAKQEAKKLAEQEKKKAKLAQKLAQQEKKKKAKTYSKVSTIFKYLEKGQTMLAYAFHSNVEKGM